MLVMDGATKMCVTKFEDLSDHYEFLEELGRYIFYFYYLINRLLLCTYT